MYWISFRMFIFSIFSLIGLCVLSPYPLLSYGILLYGIWATVFLCYVILASSLIPTIHVYWLDLILYDVRQKVEEDAISSDVPLNDYQNSFTLFRLDHQQSHRYRKYSKLVTHVSEASNRSPFALPSLSALFPLCFFPYFFCVSSLVAADGCSSSISCLSQACLTLVANTPLYSMVSSSRSISWHALSGLSRFGNSLLLLDLIPPQLNIFHSLLLTQRR